MRSVAYVSKILFFAILVSFSLCMGMTGAVRRISAAVSSLRLGVAARIAPTPASRAPVIADRPVDTVLTSIPEALTIADPILARYYSNQDQENHESDDVDWEKLASGWALCDDLASDEPRSPIIYLGEAGAMSEHKVVARDAHAARKTETPVGFVRYPQAFLPESPRDSLLTLMRTQSGKIIESYKMLYRAVELGHLATVQKMFAEKQVCNDVGLLVLTECRQTYTPFWKVFNSLIQIKLERDDEKPVADLLEKLCVLSERELKTVQVKKIPGFNVLKKTAQDFVKFCIMLKILTLYPDCSLFLDLNRAEPITVGGTLSFASNPLSIAVSFDCHVVMLFLIRSKICPIRSVDARDLLDHVTSRRTMEMLLLLGFNDSDVLLEHRKEFEKFPEIIDFLVNKKIYAR